MQELEDVIVQTVEDFEGDESDAYNLIYRFKEIIEKRKSAKFLGSLGGKASAKKLSAAQRKARATKASHSRKFNNH